MDPAPRHQCLIYDGSPVKMLPAITAQIKGRLDANFRCLYLNSAPMVAGLRSYLYAAGVDVQQVVSAGSLLLSSDPSPLKEGHFDVDRMLMLLETALKLALSEGYQGLWATGDIGWEMGLDRDLDRLLEYEWKLEQLFAKYPGLSGVCQYHAETLPRDLVCHSLLTHPALFMNNTLARTNPMYIPTDAPIPPVTPSPELKLTVKNLCSIQPLSATELE